MLDSGEKEIAIRIQPHDCSNAALLVHTLNKMKAKTTFNFFEAI